jgi:type IV secretory pathway VirB10-like protein
MAQQPLNVNCCSVPHWLLALGPLAGVMDEAKKAEPVEATSKEVQEFDQRMEHVALGHTATRVFVAGMLMASTQWHNGRRLTTERRYTSEPVDDSEEVLGVGATVNTVTTSTSASAEEAADTAGQPHEDPKSAARRERRRRNRAAKRAALRQPATEVPEPTPTESEKAEAESQDEAEPEVDDDIPLRLLKKETTTGRWDRVAEQRVQNVVDLPDVELDAYIKLKVGLDIMSPAKLKSAWRHGVSWLETNRPGMSNQTRVAILGKTLVHVAQGMDREVEAILVAMKSQEAARRGHNEEKLHGKKPLKAKPFGQGILDFFKPKRYHWRQPRYGTTQV